MEFWAYAIFLKKTRAQVLFCEIWELFKSNYFEEHLWTSASKLYLKRDWTNVFSCEFSELFQNTYFVEDLQIAGSDAPVRGSIFNKAASLAVWRLLKELVGGCHTAISLWILRNSWESFFLEHLATTSHMMLLFFLQISEVFSLKSIYLLEQ